MSKQIKWSNEEQETLLTNYHLHRKAGNGKAVSFAKAMQSLPAQRRKSTNPWEASAFNKIYESREEFKLENARAAYNPDATSRVVNSDRIYWNEEEVKALANKWVELRLEHPYETATVILEKAQRACLPGERQRSFASILSNKSVIEAINVLLLEKIEKLKTIYQPPPTPAPEVIYLEVPRKLTAAEMLKEIDEPTLEALLSAKRLARENTFHELLRAAAVHNGAANVPAVPAFVPRLEAFDAGERRTQRIAIVGLPNHQQDQARNEIIATGLNVEVRFPTPKDSLTVGRCDYAIICKSNGQDGPMNSVGDRTIGQLGRNRVVLVDDSNSTHLVQQVRNICSRQ